MKRKAGTVDSSIYTHRSVRRELVVNGTRTPVIEVIGLIAELNKESK